MKTLPNINKQVPESSDTPNIKPVSDAIEALDTALGASVSTLATTAKTLVPAVNELQANGSLQEFSVTAASGFSITGKLSKIGRLYVLPLTVTGTVPASWTTVGSIPAAYAPGTPLYVPAATGGATFGMGRILNNGDIAAYAPSGAGQINFTLVWTK